MASADNSIRWGAVGVASAGNVIRREDVGVVFSADIKRWGEPFPTKLQSGKLP